ncbi:unnamed protein product, partial [marine sediment metagenome]
TCRCKNPQLGGAGCRIAGPTTAGESQEQAPSLFAELELAQA